MPYETILFDLDGTLLDTLADLTDAVNRTLMRFAFPCRTRAEVRAFVGNGARRLMELAVPGGAEQVQFDAILDDYKADYAAHCRVHTAPYPGVPELLRTLCAQGKRLAIVSNKPDDAVQALQRDFFPNVSVAVGERAGVRRKPAPDTVLAALQQLGAGPENAVYVGDSEVDLETARNAGLPCISVSWGFRDRELLLAHGAQAVADNCAQLLELV